MGKLNSPVSVGLFLILSLMLPFCGLRAGASGTDEMLLVEGGKSLAPIILPKDPTFFNRIAAKDLAEYIGKVGGAKPEIIEGAPNPVPAHAIWVGFQPKLKEVFPGTDFDFKNPEEILIKTDGKNLVIAGRDIWDPITNKMVIKGGKTEKEKLSNMIGFQYSNRDVEGFQFEYGTVNAVYTFLQDRLGIRWLWPGAQGEVIPKLPRIAYKPFEFRYNPKIRMRHGIFGPIAIYRNDGGPGTSGGDWVRRQRVQLDSIYIPAGHGFADWHERFYEKNRDYFAMQSNGKREWLDPNTYNVKICESNPAVWDQWMKDVEEIIAKNPHHKAFSAAENDGYNLGICTCDKCRAWDSPAAERRIWMYPKGSRVTGVALSDRQVTFANTLGRMLKKRYPDKDYKVQLLSYGYSRPAPIKVVPDDNVVIVNVANCFTDPDAIDSNSPLSTKGIDQFEAWAKITKNQIWRPNTGDAVRWQTGGPPSITRTGEIFKRMTSIGILGICIDQIWLYWATQGPQYYLMAQLAWSPDKGIDEIMDDYYKSGFGPAAEDIKAYWKMLEDNRNEIQRYENKKGGKSWTETFNPEFFKVAYANLDKAAGKVSKSKEYSYRIGFVRAGLDYLRLNTENQALAKQIIESKSPAPAIKEKMRVNWKQIEDIAKKYPQALRNGIVERNPASGYLGYIHPDADHKAIEEKRLQKEAARARNAKNALAPNAGLE